MFGVCCKKVTMATIDGCCIGCFALFNFASPVVLYCVIFLWKFTLTTHVPLSHPVFLKGVGFKVVSWCELLCIMGFCAAQTRCFFALALVHKLAWRVVHPAAVKPQTTVTLAKSTTTFLCFCLHPSDLLPPFVLLSSQDWILCSFFVLHFDPSSSLSDAGAYECKYLWTRIFSTVGNEIEMCKWKRMALERLQTAVTLLRKFMSGCGTGFIVAPLFPWCQWHHCCILALTRSLFTIDEAPISV